MQLITLSQYRVACTFNSPRYQADRLELYRLLRTATIEVTDNITTVLRIAQDGRVADVEETVAKLHISEHASRLTIYLPRDRKAQEICFCDLLPRQIVDWLMRDPTTQILETLEADMVKIIIMMFSIHPSAIDLVLDREGVTEVDIANEDSRVEDDLSFESSEQSDTNSNGDFRQSADTETSSPIQNVQFSTQFIARQTSMASYQPSPSGNQSISVSLFNGHLSEDNLQYQRLLDHVIQAARRASFPSNGAFGITQLDQALPRDGGLGQHEGFDGPEVRNSFRSDGQLERDKRVGAVGELYVCIISRPSRQVSLPSIFNI
jgi:hypothetical protein